MCYTARCMSGDDLGPDSATGNQVTDGLPGASRAGIWLAIGMAIAIAAWLAYLRAPRRERLDHAAEHALTPDDDAAAQPP